MLNPRRPTDMPYLNIQTNADIGPKQQAELLDQASRLVAGMLGKPESYVMVALQAGVAMRFGGSDAPLAYLELKSLGLPKARSAELSATLSEWVGQVLAIPAARVYIEFSDPKRSMWGWNSGTF